MTADTPWHLHGHLFREPALGRHRFFSWLKVQCNRLANVSAGFLKGIAFGNAAG